MAFHLAADGYHAFLIALAQQLDAAALEVDVRQLHAGDLARARRGVYEDQQQAQVAVTFGRSGVHRAEQLPEVFRGVGLDDALSRARQPKAGERRKGYEAFGRQPVKKTRRERQ